MTLLDDVLAATDRFDREAAIERYPWFTQDHLDCVISTDADGQLCGLLLSHLQGWRIRGFYDGKALVVDHRVNPQDCIFVDVEVFRQGVRSFGNHMLLFNANRRPEGWDDRFQDCFAINNRRGHDRRRFNRKYPFASIHFLLVITAARHSITPPPSAAGPLLFADGVYKLLLQYTENAWDWMRYLGVESKQNPLHALFHSPDLSVYDVMTKMLKFWERRDRLSLTGHRGDRIAITERGGSGRVVNLVEDSDSGRGLWRYKDEARQRIEDFLSLLSDLTKWRYEPDRWSWEGWRLFEFDKGIDTEMSNIPRFNAILQQDPLSWAITANNRCEYTVERPDNPSPLSRQ